MMDTYSIDGKKVGKTKFYSHLEKMYIEQQKYAELGRLAVGAIDTADRKTEEGVYTTLPCGYDSPVRRDWYREGTMHPTQCPKCTWLKFCQKRAELMANNQTSKVCSACNGSGYYDSHGSPKCGACDGTGITGGGVSHANKHM